MAAARLQFWLAYKDDQKVQIYRKYPHGSCRIVLSQYRIGWQMRDRLVVLEDPGDLQDQQDQLALRSLVRQNSPLIE